MYAAGRPMRTISAEVGAHRHTIATWTADLPRRRAGGGHRVDKEALKLAIGLTQVGATQSEAAEMVGCSQAVVSRALAEARSDSNHPLAALRGRLPPRDSRRKPWTAASHQ